VTDELNSVRRGRGLKEISMQEVLGSNAKMMIANTVPGLEFPRSFHPRAQFVGSLVDAAEPLDCGTKKIAFQLIIKVLIGSAQVRDRRLSRDFRNYVVG
jgi:hypothetical protein